MWPGYLIRLTTSSEQFHKVMNSAHLKTPPTSGLVSKPSAHRIDATTLSHCPKPLTGQYYTSNEDLAAYKKAQYNISIKASPCTILKTGSRTMLKMASHIILKSAPCTMLGVILYHRVEVDDGFAMSPGRYWLCKKY